MPLLSELSGFIDPTADAESDPTAYGEHYRENLDVDEEVGRRTIQREQKNIVGKSPTEFAGNLVENVGDFATGLFSMATFPFAHPVKTAEAAAHPIETGKYLAGAMYEGYKQAYTPQEGESVPGMLLRRLYERPFDTLMDASGLAQVATGGASILARGATMGLRGAAEGAEAASSLTRAAGGGGALLEGARDVAEAAGKITPEFELARRAAKARKVIETFDWATEKAKQLDPISIAQNTGKAALNWKYPDLAAAMEVTKQMTEKKAARAAELTAAQEAHEQMVTEAFKPLNQAERHVIWPYISGRVNMTRPVGEQLMSHTGEWVPLKGDTIRPDVLEQVRQAYGPIAHEYERRQNLLPEQVAENIGAESLHEASKFLGEHFDPLSPQVQEFVTNNVKLALERNHEARVSRATGEMRTALDIAKERQHLEEVQRAVNSKEIAIASQEAQGLPRPTETTPEEALRLMGPQGGIYFPHSAETFNAHQSTIKNILLKAGEARTYQHNTYALFRSGVMEHQDPVSQILRAFNQFDKGKSWVQMGYEAAEESVKNGTGAQRMKTSGKNKWNYQTDPDVLAGTHQPWHPGMMLSEHLTEEEGQHMLTRLMETIDEHDTVKVPAADMTIDAVTVPQAASGAGPLAPGGLPAGVTVGNMNFVDIMRGLVKGAERGEIYRPKRDTPLYKIPTDMGHAFKSFRDSMEPPTNPLIQKLDNITSWWNWTNLSTKTTRLTNNIVGNTMFAAMQGILPFTPRGLQSIVAMGRAMGAKAGLLKGTESQRLAKVFELPGIRSGGLQLDLNREAGTVASRLSRSKILPVRMVGKWSNLMQHANSNVENAFRAMSLFYEMSPGIGERVKRMTGNMEKALTLGDRVAELEKAGAGITMKNPEYRANLNAVNRYFHDYSHTTPTERMVVRRIFPYYKFFKHSAELITRFPFEHPLKAQVARNIGNAAVQDIKDTFKNYGLNYDRDVQPHLKDGIPMYKTTDDEGKPVVWVFNTKGTNPFSQMTGYPAEQMLQMLNPLIKIGLERATGVNLFTRERYRGAVSSITGREVDPKDGSIVDSFNHPSVGESFLRSFWPYQTVRELAQQGRVPTDTASLFEMATNGPNAWEYDERGFPVRKPIAHPAAAVGRFFGTVPTPIQEPTEKQKSARKGVVNQQLNTLYQRYPGQRQRILDAINATSEEVSKEYEDSGL